MRLRSQLIAALLPVLVAAPAMAQESAPTQQQVTPAAGVQPDAGAGAQFDPTAAPCGGDFDAWKQGITEEAKAAGHPWPFLATNIVATMGCADLTHEGGATEIWP